MSQEAKYSFSIKQGAHVNQPLLTVRGDSAQEFAANLTAIGLPAQEILTGFGSTGVAGATEQAVQNIQDAGLDPTVLPSNQPPPQQHVPQAAPIQQTTPWGGGASAATFQVPTCHHGARQHRTGVSSKGPWQAWFCPSPKGTPDQCKGIFQNDPDYVAPIGA